MFIQTGAAFENDEGVSWGAGASQAGPGDPGHVAAPAGLAVAAS